MNVFRLDFVGLLSVSRMGGYYTWRKQTRVCRLHRHRRRIVGKQEDRFCKACYNKQQKNNKSKGDALKKNIISSLVYITVFFVFFSVVYYFSYHSQSKFVYGLIAGWMGCLWISYIMKMKLPTAFFVFVMTAIFYIAILILPVETFYHDAPGEFSWHVLLIAGISGVFYTLPIIINNLVFLIEKKVKKLSVIFKKLSNLE
jgi:hypothetical protein